jgi:hypothetical protein
MLVRMQRNQSAHTLLVGMQNDIVTQEHRLATSYKVKYTLTMSHSKEMKTYIKNKTPMCAATFFKIAKE